ncbi:hypothetical protein RRG08_038232 [Elysia crispata]|uniref:Uncharacterized protein n=1 Tax=Elysia crispata TaxID=231223 RepID=A0AAE1E1D8_9GAST|nr:hypothetical protein RRG08_038232 [Elysia crispata]
MLMAAILEPRETTVLSSGQNGAGRERQFVTRPENSHLTCTDVRNLFRYQQLPGMPASIYSMADPQLDECRSVLSSDQLLLLTAPEVRR